MKSDFIVAVHGLVYLKHKGCITSSEELAANICTNPARVRKIMAHFKKAGIVVTKEGSVGGYCPCPRIGALSLAAIVRALQLEVVEHKWQSGKDDMHCLISSGMASLMDEVFADLNEVCLEHLQQVTIADLEQKIFRGKNKNGQTS